MTGDLLDRRHIDPRLDLLAAQRARQQQAEQPGLVQRADQRFGKILPGLDLVGDSRNCRPERAGAGDRIGRAGREADIVHGKDDWRAAAPDCQWRSLAMRARRLQRAPLGRRIFAEQRPRNVAARRWLTSATSTLGG
jgi:hypothetical protein